MTIKVQIGLRVTEEIRDKLYEEAENQNRSVNNLIEHIIAKYFKEKEEKEEK
ncbi:MAG: Arc family DNA-binding protein [Ruminococcaceae bacterium]|nr:Arc family DNA-binding protein [Oscillospiraceae bacterium]